MPKSAGQLPPDRLDDEERARLADLDRCLRNGDVVENDEVIAWLRQDSPASVAEQPPT